MIDSNVYQTNDGAETISPVVSEADSFLLNQAKRNIEERKKLVRRVAAYIVGWLVLLILFVAVFETAQHPRAREGQNIVTDLSIMRATAAEEESGALRRAINFIQYQTGPGYIHPMFFVLLGVMLCWSGWIAVQVGKRIAMKRTVSLKRRKRDPVLQEYNRLKMLASNEM